MKGYVTAAVVRDLAADLSPWDRALLATLRTVRVATTAQLARLHGGSVSARHCRRRLAALSERRLITRLERIVGGQRSGSSGWIYALDVAGLRLTDVPGKYRRPWTPGLRFLAHSLAVTELFVGLKEVELTNSVEVLDFVTEPDCWRSIGGGHGDTLLKPDAYLRLGVGEFEDHYFLEVDRATVSPATLVRQCSTYLQAWQSSSVEAELGVFPQVLWTVPDERRQALLSDVVAIQPPEAAALFAVVHFDRAVRLLTGGQS